MATLGMNVNLESNTIVERCMNKMARDITVQIKEKLADIIIAKLQQKYLFDLDEARRFIMDELPSEVDVQKTQRVKKPVELDAEGNPRNPRKRNPSISTGLGVARESKVAAKHSA